MAIRLALPQADVSRYVNDANGVSKSHQLDLLDFVSSDGSIISSVEWPARFGYKFDWVTQPEDWAARGAFWMKVDTQDGPALALVAVRVVPVGDKNLVHRGRRAAGPGIFGSLVLPAEMRALLYLNLDPSFQPANLMDASGTASQAERFAGIIDQERQNPGEHTAKIAWTSDAISAEEFHALPLQGRREELLGVLLVGNSQRKIVTLERQILLARVRRGAGWVFHQRAAELVGRGARYAAGAKTGGRRAGSFGRELGRARGSARWRRNRAAGAVRSIG